MRWNGERSEHHPIRLGTDGWRELLGEGFTGLRLETLVDAFDGWLTTRGERRAVLVGHDARFMAAHFARRVAERLAQRGRTAYLQSGPFPTPAIAWAVSREGLAAGVVVTASHNPPEYLGIKFIADHGGPLEPFPIEAHASPPDPPSQPSAMRLVDVWPGYARHLVDLVDARAIARARPMVEIHLMHGATHRFPALLRSLGCRLGVAGVNPDPRFGGGPPDPSPERLRRFARRVAERRPQLGLALDGDGDRFAVLAPDGRVLDVQDALVLLADQCLARSEGGVARSLVTTRALDRVAEWHGRAAVEVPVGFRHVSRALRSGAAVGAEESGGFGWSAHIPGKDGLVACLLLIERLSRHPDMEGWWLDAWRRFGRWHRRRVDLPVANGEAEARLHSWGRRAEAWAVNQGARCDQPAPGHWRLALSNGWAIVRASGTEPLIRLYVESSDEVTAEALAGLAEGWLRAPPDPERGDGRTPPDPHTPRRRGA